MTPLTAELLWRLPRVGPPRLSPDGQLVACTVSRARTDMASLESSLHLVPRHGGACRRMTHAEGKDTEPTWSPDSQQLGFVRRGTAPEDQAQLYRMPVAGGEPERLTDLPVSVSSPRWHPDGRRLLFVAPWVRGATSWEEAARILAERRESPGKVRATEHRLYRFWQRWLHEEDYPHLFQLDLEDRTVTDLTPQLCRHLNLSEGGCEYDLAPDGTQLALAAMTTEPPFREHLRYGIHLLDLTPDGAVGEPRELTANRPGTFTMPRYSPAGDRLAYLWREDPAFYADPMRLGLHHLVEGRDELLTGAWDRSVGAYEWAPDGSFLACAAEEGHRTDLFTLEPRPGPPTRCVGEGSCAGVQVAPDGELVFLHHSLSRPPELARAGGPGATAAGVVHLTDLCGPLLQGVTLGQVRELEFPGAGGDAVGLVVVEPPGFDPARRWPLLHLVHGGPHGQFGDGWHWRWNAQVLAGLGYLCALVNFHGSTGRGQVFTRSILGEHPIKPMEDLMRATDLLLETGAVDSERMAVAGGSYGGYLVTWVAGHTQRFRCAINHAGVADLLTQMGSDVTHGRFLAYGGEPWTNLEVIERHSPVRYCRDMETPMLILHGEQDFRVPVGNALELYGILQGKGVPSRLVLYPEEGHWIQTPASSLHWYGEVTAWLARWLEPEEPPGEDLAHPSPVLE